VSTYANRFGVAAGKSVAIFTNGSSGYRAAEVLAARGVGIAALIDSRTQAADAVPEGVRLIRGGSIVDTKGRQRVRGIVTDRGGFEELIACDAVAMSGGWSPVVHLACQRGGKPVWSEALQAFLAPQVGGLVMAGAAAGHYRLSECFED